MTTRTTTTTATRTCDACSAPRQPGGWNKGYPWCARCEPLARAQREPLWYESIYGGSVAGLHFPPCPDCGAPHAAASMLPAGDERSAQVHAALCAHERQQRARYPWWPFGG